MAKAGKQIVNEIRALKEEIASLNNRHEPELQTQSLGGIVKTMMEEREKTNKILVELTKKVTKLESDIDNLYSGSEQDVAYGVGNREIPLSSVDSTIINFIQRRPNSMACADEVTAHMKYRGRNAACARLNRLYKDGLLERLQLGHRVYYKFDAGKTTNTLIISPPQ